MKAKTITNKLDPLWRQAVKATYGERCEICGKRDGLNIHHVIGRRNKAVRWFVPNGTVLCVAHHTFGLLSAHQNPIWFLEFLTKKRGTKWLDELKAESNKIVKPVKDYEKIKEYLEEILNETRA